MKSLDNTGLARLLGLINAKFAAKVSPNFSGTPTAPTASIDTNSTQIATTAFTTSLINSVDDYTSQEIETLWNNYFNIPLILDATTNQTITLVYTEPGGSAQTKTSTSSVQNFTVKKGTTWTATIVGESGYTAGTLSPGASGTVTEAITISATTAEAIIVLTDSYYKMRDVYPNTYRSMTEVPDILDSSNITTTEEMFRGCTALTVSPELDTLNVGNMNRMFYECTNLTTVSQMDTSNVNYMDGMFYNCSSLPEEFSWAIGFDSIHGSVQNMFKGSSVTSVALANVANTVKSIYITSEKLKGDNTLTINFVNIPNYHIGSIYPDTYRSMTSVDINTIKTQHPGILDNLTSVAHMFYNCVALTTISNVNQLDISKVTNMKSMFHLCRALTSVPQLDTSDVTNMESMFHTCNALTSVPQLDTSNVTNMAYMFFDCQSLPSTFPWTIDCSSITDAYNMNGMFVYSPVTSVTLSNVNSSIRSQVTPQRLKDNSLTITFV